MTQPQQSPAALDHARHDSALIAAFADRVHDLSDADRTLANDRIAVCEGCRDLFADLVIIRDQLATSATPARPREFTLTAEDARRLRSTGWRRALGFFGSARDAFSRPLAIGFTTIGIVALAVTASPLSFGMSGGQSAAAPVLETVGNGVGGAGGAAPAASAAGVGPSQDIAGVVVSAAPSAAASAAASEAAPSASAAASAAPASAAFTASGPAPTAATGPSSKGGDSGQVFTGSNDSDNVYGDDDGDSTDATPVAGRAVTSDARSLGLAFGAVCLVLGFGLFVLRWTSRRLRNA